MGWHCPFGGRSRRRQKQRRFSGTTQSGNPEGFFARANPAATVPLFCFTGKTTFT
jgi:hypothetical protein